jgi:hypothetical protein
MPGKANLKSLRVVMRVRREGGNVLATSLNGWQCLCIVAPIDRQILPDLDHIKPRPRPCLGKPARQRARAARAPNFLRRLARRQCRLGYCLS